MQVPSEVRGEGIQGHVRGGQQPVSSATIQLYAAGASGPGAGAMDLLAPNDAMTNAAGFVNITGDYTCPSTTTQVYLIARGGNPGLAQGESNPALVMMAALGDCSALSSATIIEVNEVTTAAATWALAQLMGAGAMVGASATNATGLANAFAVAANLADTSTGLAPGSALPAWLRRWRQRS